MIENHNFGSFDSEFDELLAQVTGDFSFSDNDEILVERMVDIPTEANLGNRIVLDADQLRILPRKREIWNSDLNNAEAGPPLNGDTAHSGWRFTWAGVKNANIAIEKEQVRKTSDDKVYMEHWDHVMTFPEDCAHAM